MTNFKKQLFAVISAGAVLLNATSAYAATTSIEITGNGRDSDSTANVNMNTSTAVVQSNNAFVTNSVNVSQNTGDNKANDNGAGDVAIHTGNSDANVTVSNDLNTNKAQVDCCPTGNTEVKIAENGRNSDNEVNLNQSSETGLFQTNDAYVGNYVSVDSNTGDNKANDNIGGSVDIHTGSSDATVTVSTEANKNFALVGGNSGSSANGNVSAMIVGNGRNSDNDINLNLNRDVELLQENWAYVTNLVDVSQNTGDNKANDNNGEVLIHTKNATANVDVDNSVNFNHANIDCGCLLGVSAKIGGNLRDSYNEINANLGDEEVVYQDNWADLWNDPYVDQNTGYNKANDNNAGDGDPSIHTGTADAEEVNVSNSGNVNSYGVPFTLPGGSSHTDVSVTFNLSFLKALLGLS